MTVRKANMCGFGFFVFIYIRNEGETNARSYNSNETQELQEAYIERKTWGNYWNTSVM